MKKYSVFFFFLKKKNCEKECIHSQQDHQIWKTQIEPFPIIKKTKIWHESNDNVTKFLVITTQKSGSTWLVRRLDTHPDFQTFPFEPLRRPMKRCLLETGYHCNWDLVQFKLTSFYRTLYKNIRRGRGSNAGHSNERSILGFKVMYNQVRHVLPELIEWCSANQIKVIHFYRGTSVSSYWSYGAQFIDRFTIFSSFFMHNSFLL